MSGDRKKRQAIIMGLSIVLLIAGVVGVVLCSRIGEGELFWNMPRQTWETVSLACLNAGWIGVIAVYLSNWFKKRSQR